MPMALDRAKSDERQGRIRAKAIPNQKPPQLAVGNKNMAYCPSFNISGAINTW